MLEAHESMRLSQVSAYPHMKKSNQSKVFKNWRKDSVIKSVGAENEKPVTTAELANRLGRMLNGK